MKEKKIRIEKNGPYIIEGTLELSEEIIQTDKKGISVSYKKGKKYPAKETYILCRCGESKNHPYCDGSHSKIAFDGTETASRKSFLSQAGVIDGPDLTLYDVEDLCAYARFCDRGRRIWNMVENPKNKTETKMAIEESFDCPAGRLVLRDKKTKKIINPKQKQELILIQDPPENVSGPIRVKGGVQVVSSDGFEYEKRQQQTLCRCGRASNKPFCDGTHVSCKFQDDYFKKDGKD